MWQDDSGALLAALLKLWISWVAIAALTATAYAREQIRLATLWLLQFFTRELPWNTRQTPPLPRSEFHAELIIVDVFLIDGNGERARYEKTSWLVANSLVQNYEEAVTGTGRLFGFRSMRGTIIGTREEHGFHVSRIDLGSPVPKDSKVINVFSAELKDCFKGKIEQWTQEVALPAAHLAMQIHFPRTKPPKAVRGTLLQGLTERSCRIAPQLTDLYGCKSVVWSIQTPQVGDVYKVEWVW